VAGPDDCWLWIGRSVVDGYGVIATGGRGVRRTIRAHRYAYELAYGPIPDGLSVLHNCPTGDNPACCNARHLWLGTAADNARDMVAKGRALHGERAHCAKLTAAQVVQIRQRYRPRVVTQYDLAAEYGVTQSLINMIIRGRIWTHLLGVPQD
jgi:hypothetical protein